MNKLGTAHVGDAVVDVYRNHLIAIAPQSWSGIVLVYDDQERILRSGLSDAEFPDAAQGSERRAMYYECCRLSGRIIPEVTGEITKATSE